jgi:hypothetical protein
MVICAACKQYTDDDGAFCQQCGQPLVAATFDALRSPLRPQTLVANLAADQQRAQLVASGVIGQYPSSFFSEDARPYPLLAGLFGAPATREQQAEILLFAAVAYLVESGHMTMQRGTGLISGFLCQEALPWEGQLQCLEGQLALGSRLEMTLLEALQRTVADAVGLRLEVRVVDEDNYTVDRTEADLAALPQILRRIQEEQRRSLDNWFLASTETRSTQVQAWMAYPTATGVIEMARQTVLPPHGEAAACHDTYQMLARFIHRDQERAGAIVREIQRVLRWFGRCEEQPSQVGHRL